MVLTYEFCETRAGEAASAAHDATLDNVRDRALRSEAAWRAMGNRLRAIHAQRKKIGEQRADAVDSTDEIDSADD